MGWLWYNGVQYHREAGDMANKRAVPVGRFLRQLERVINWQVISERLI